MDHSDLNAAHSKASRWQEYPVYILASRHTEIEIYKISYHSLKSVWDLINNQIDCPAIFQRLAVPIFTVMHSFVPHQPVYLLQENPEIPLVRIR